MDDEKQPLFTEVIKLIPYEEQKSEIDIIHQELGIPEFVIDLAFRSIVLELLESIHAVFSHKDSFIYNITSVIGVDYMHLDIHQNRLYGIFKCKGNYVGCYELHSDARVLIRKSIKLPRSSQKSSIELNKNNSENSAIISMFA